MSKEHFETGSSEGKDLGIIQPVIKDYKAPLRRDKFTTVFGVKYYRPSEEGTGGVVAEETVREDALPTTGRKRGAPKEPKRIGTAAETPRGYAEGARPATKPVAAALSAHIGTYKTVLNNASSVRSLSAEHAGAVDTARYHIAQAERSHGLAYTEGKLGTNTMNRDVAHGHLQDAADHLSSAHEAVVASGVHHELSKHHLNAEIPSDDRISEAVSSAYQLPRVGKGGVAGAKKSFTRVKFGKANLPGAAIDKELIDRAVEVGGKDHVGVQKLAAGQGTKRDPMRRENRNAALEQINKDVVAKGGKALKNLPTGAGGMISGIDKTAAVNPKRRGSGKRIDTRFSSDANKIGRTPRFEG